MMRCAIYTRKSVEEGLAQEFSSLDAQRDAGEAYILSQRHAGWTLLPERYDDGGYTGANLDRPALQRLLAAIETGGVDCVLVYKVDRLSRSLLDFVRVMGTFEQHGVSLVSVTQQFNTTTSLGRLTLNILLSFAQFERELIAERTRDKMGAARRKGKWVGGIPVLGYDVAPGGGKLVIQEEEARQVRALFVLYLEHRALQPVLDHIRQQGWTTKRWTTQAGKCYAGKPFSLGVLLRLLRNVLYAGKIRYQGQIYPGEHEAIVEERVWERVQVLLQSHKTGRAASRPRGQPLPIDEAVVQGANRWRAVPRITRLLALAWKFDGMIQQGVVKDYAQLARLGQVSRARVTQIMNLLNLAPDIQEQILSWEQSPPTQPNIWETSVRALRAEVLWSRQRQQWKSSSRGAG